MMEQKQIKDSSNNMKNKFSIKNENSKSVQKGKKLICQLCKKNFTSSQYLKIHIKRFHEGSGGTQQSMHRVNGIKKSDMGIKYIYLG